MIIKERAETRVLLMSGYPNQDILDESPLRSRVAFIQKPFSPNVLLREVRVLLALGPTEA